MINAFYSSIISVLAFISSVQAWPFLFKHGPKLYTFVISYKCKCLTNTGYFKSQLAINTR